MAIQHRSVSGACGQCQLASVPVASSSRRTCTNARHVIKALRRASEQLVRNDVAVPHALPSRQPITPPSAALQRQNSLQGEIQDVCGDYFAALRAYRQMQAELGPKAAQAVRQLSNNRSLLTYNAASRSALYDEVVGTLEGVTREQLAELVSLRRRLLHELPRVKAQVSEIVEEQSMGSRRGAGATHFRKPDSTNCNGLYTLEVVPNSVKQWVRSKEYSMRKARNSSSSSSSSKGASREEAPLTGLQQQQQSYHPMGNQAPVPPSIAGAIPQQLRTRMPSSIARSQALHAAQQQQQQQDPEQQQPPPPMATGRTGKQHLVAEQEHRASMPSQQALLQFSSDAGYRQIRHGTPSSAEPKGPVNLQGSNLPAISTAGQELEQPGSEPQGSSGGGNYLDQPVQLGTSSSRLRAAALAAAKYQQSKQGKKGAEAGSGSGSQAPTAAGEQQQQQPPIVPGAVEVGNRQAVYTAPRKSRANAEEASFLICP